MPRLLRSIRLDREEGQVLPFFAAALLALVLMTGIVIDGGNLFQNRQSLQNAADASAIAAALEVAKGNCPDPSTLGDACSTVAATYAFYNGATSNANPLVPCPGSVTATKAPVAPGCFLYDSSNNTVEVWLTKSTSNFFGGVLGIGTSAESARAVAIATPITSNTGPGTYIYSSGGVTLDGGADVQEPIIAQGDLSMTGTTNVNAIARLVAVGLSGMGSYDAGGTIGDGSSLTTLTAPMTSAATTMSVASTAGFLGSGTVLVAPNSSCSVFVPTAPCEWIAYGGKSGTQLTGLTRGYGGDNSTPPTHSSGDPVDPRLADFWAPGGCSSGCGNVKTVHKGVYSFTPPIFNINSAFAHAELGPTHACSLSAGTVPTFGGGGVPTDPTTTKDLTTPNGGYICERLDSGSNVVGEIAWGGNHGITLGAEDVPAGELKVIGTIFFNANLQFSNDAIYQTGSAGAVIWTTGNLSLSSNTSVLANCGTAIAPVKCGTTTSSFWNPNLNALGIVAHKANSASNAANNAITFNGGKTELQALLYTDGDFMCGGNCTFQGLLDGEAVDSTAVWFHGGVAAPSPTITNLPPDFPTQFAVSLFQ